DPECRREGDSLRWGARGLSAARKSEPAGFSTGGGATAIAGGAKPGGVSGAAGAGRARRGRVGAGGAVDFDGEWSCGGGECDGSAAARCGIRPGCDGVQCTEEFATASGTTRRSERECLKGTQSIVLPEPC